MLTETMTAALNAQINKELRAFYTYLSMAAYFEDDGLKGFAAWMRHHAEEEMLHAMKIYDFVLQRRGRVTLQAIDAPRASWESAKNAFEDALHHEQNVTASIHALVDTARKEGDHATETFLIWFVNEQVEEEEIVDEVLQKVTRIGDFAPALFLLDRDLATDAAAAATSAEGTSEGA
ncbi:MAG TPA: ferritin [Aggregatilineales bacterium]|nr:ferritin [Anaerolineales bacterium]HRE48127.1 ferritin [Aggregatilineales bacterium]